MIDIHSHILPGIDDGATDIDESLQMLELARKAGTRAMIATPHADLRYRFDANQSRELLAELQQRCPNGPKLHSGCEVHLTPENIQAVLANPTDFTLNSGDCTLLELPDRIVPAMIQPAVEALMSSGLRVIIAHPERNPYIQQQFCYAQRLVEMGCYLQITARSFNGGFGPVAAATSAQIMKRRLAHFVATDAHGATKRKPGLSTAFETIESTHGESVARTLLVSNPDAVLRSAPISSMPAAPSWLNFFFSKPSHAQRNSAHA